MSKHQKQVSWGMETTSAPLATHCFLFIVDTSGSMSTAAGKKGLETANFSRISLVKYALQVCISMMNETCQAGIIQFNSTASVLCPIQSLTPDKKDEFKLKINDMYPNGSTNVKSAFELARSMLSNADPNLLYHVLLLSDGEPDAKIDPVEVASNICISTCSFGPNCDMSLMYNMISNGAFLFAFDGSTVGQVFVHFVAERLVTTTDKNLRQGQVRFIENGLPITEEQTKLAEDRELLIDLLKTIRLNMQMSDGFTTCSKAITETYHVLQTDLFKEELISLDPAKGQVNKAIEHWKEWGMLYITSLQHAHERQSYSNLKDASLSIYNSPELEMALLAGKTIFMNMAPPQATLHDNQYASVPMAVIAPSYNSGGCFTGDTLVHMASGIFKRMDMLVAGDEILSGDVIEHVVRFFGPTKVYQFASGFSITPYHPMKIDKWVFPEHAAQVKTPGVANVVYNLILKNRSCIHVQGGIECVTFGHGLIGDVVEHDFFGTNKVIDCILKLATPRDHGLLDMPIVEVTRKNGKVTDFTCI